MVKQERNSLSEAITKKTGESCPKDCPQSAESASQFVYGAHGTEDDGYMQVGSRGQGDHGLGVGPRQGLAGSGRCLLLEREGSAPSAGDFASRVSGRSQEVSWEEE